MSRLRNTAKFLLILSLFLSSRQIFAQKQNERIEKSNCAEKWWAVFHPFKARKAYKISEGAESVADSLYKSNIPDKMKNGGKSDAFRHAYWMLTLAKRIGIKRARSLGKAHEKGNKKALKKSPKSLNDFASTEMDLKNDSIALSFSKQTNSLSKQQLIAFILKKIQAGKFYMIKHDENGNWLNEAGEIIPNEKLYGVWKNERCLTKTNDLL